MSADVELSHAVERLLARHVESVGVLDLLLLLHAGRDRDWSAEEICRSLRCPDGWAHAQLERLRAAGLCAQVAPGRFRYERVGRWGTAVDELARACRQDRAVVTRMVFARPVDSDDGATR